MHVAVTGESCKKSAKLLEKLTYWINMCECYQPDLHEWM